MTLYKITEFYRKQFSVYPSITSKYRSNAILKISVIKIIIQIQRIGMSTIFYCTKLRLSKCKSS
jgi:hypothetical protein